MSEAGPEELICSSKGCTAPALHQVLWNNPRLHTPDRRKIWLACDEHEQSLRRFLDARGFYRSTEPVGAGSTSVEETGA